MAFASTNFIRQTGGPISFYEEYTASNLYVERVFGGNCQTITLSNDSETDDIQASFDGATLEAELKPGETFSFNVSTKTSIRIKGTAGGDNVRIWGW